MSGNPVSSTVGRSSIVATATAEEASPSGVSWAAVVAGAFVTAATGLLLMTLGAGMGLSSISVWPSRTAHATRVAAGAIVWIVVVQLLAGALGGYLAGRLRTRWVSVHTHEVYFRDTAHGLLVWAVGVVLSAAFLGTLASSVATEMAGRPSEAAPKAADYYADALFRTTTPPPAAISAEERAEAGTILDRNLARASFDPGDLSYLAALVAARTGLSQSDAARRVETTAANQRVALEESRKAIAHSLYWLVVALLIGAFSSSCAALAGGRKRDRGWA